MAAVCPINDPAIAQVGLFNRARPDRQSHRRRTVRCELRDRVSRARNGSVVADPVDDFAQIQFVRTRIVNFQHRMLIPFGTYLFTTPDFATTLRRESLGVPRDGVIQPC